MADQRDELTWVALELTHQGEEGVQDGTIVKSLCNELGVAHDFPIFVPAATYPKGQKTITIQLMEGYVFVASGLPDTDYFNLERGPHVHKVLSASGPQRIRGIQVITNSHIESLRQQLRQLLSSDIGALDRVQVIDGTYRGLDGVVVGLDGDSAFVEIHMRSLEMVATIPLVFLDTMDSED